MGVAFKVFKPYFLPSTRKAGLEARSVHSNWDTIGSGRNGELDYWLHQNLFLVLCGSMVNQQSRLFFINRSTGKILVIPSTYQETSLNIYMLL